MNRNRLVHFARLGVSLRWRLATNRLRRQGKKTRRWTKVVGVGYAIVNIGALSTARVLEDGDAASILVLLSSSMALGWIFGPILMGGVDETIDPTRLALLPLGPKERFVVQFSAAISGAGPLLTVFGLVGGLIAGYTHLDLSIVFVPLAGLLMVLVALGFARTFAAALTIAQRSRAGRDMAVLLASMVAGVLLVMVQLASEFDDARGAAVVDILRWAPWAWPARGAIAANEGRMLASFGWLVVSGGLAAATLAAWSALSSFLLIAGERIVRTEARPGKALLNGADSVFGAAMSRQWIYFRRSPNTRVGFVFGLMFGVSFALVQLLRTGSSGEAYAPFWMLLAMVANLGATTNLLGFDAGSMWLEVLSGGPKRVHMLARALIALPNLLIPTWLSGVVLGFWTGQWRMTLVASLLAVGVAVVVMAVGLVASVLVPWPLPDGDHPFGNRTAMDSRGPRLILVAVSAVLVTAIFAGPFVGVSYAVRDQAWVWMIPLIELAVATMILGLVLFWVGRRLRGNEPEYIERLSPVALN